MWKDVDAEKYFAENSIVNFRTPRVGIQGQTWRSFYAMGWTWWFILTMTWSRLFDDMFVKKHNMEIKFITMSILTVLVASDVTFLRGSIGVASGSLCLIGRRCEGWWFAFGWETDCGGASPLWHHQLPVRKFGISLPVYHTSTAEGTLIF